MTMLMMIIILMTLLIVDYDDHHINDNADDDQHLLPRQVWSSGKCWDKNQANALSEEKSADCYTMKWLYNGT